LDNTGVKNFFECYEQFIKQKETVSLKCFSDSLGENYKLLTDEMKKQIEDKLDDYDKMEFTKETKNEKEISLTNDWKKSSK